MRNLAIDIGDAFKSPFGGTSSRPGASLGDLIGLVLRLSFVLAGLLILVMFLVAGFQMIAGAGQNNPDSAKKGQQAATAAAIGFVIVFVAYWIIRIIEVITGVYFITGLPFG